MSDVEAEMLAMEREGNLRAQEWCFSCGTQLMKLRNKDLFCCKCDMTVMMHANGHKKNSSDIGNEGYQNNWKPSRELADERMALYLLNGWTMLADACPNISPMGCSYPLMRSPEGEVVCVYCNQIEGEESSNAGEKEILPPPPHQMDSQNSGVNQGGHNNGVSSELGALLLQGYKMTAENCTDCRTIPLMLSPSEDNLLCVQCRKFFGGQANDATRAAAESSTSPDFVIIPPESDEKVSATSLISQKLLEGYAMLAECCTHCLVPIMRDLSGVEQCIICSQEPNTQNSIPLTSRDSGKRSMEDKKNQTEKTTTTPLVASPPSPEPTIRMPRIQSGGDAASLLQMKNDESHTRHQEICSHATNATYGKLAYATQLLEAAECVSSTKAIAELIGSLANAIASLNNLHH